MCTLRCHVRRALPLRAAARLGPPAARRCGCGYLRTRRVFVNEAVRTPSGGPNAALLPLESQPGLEDKRQLGGPRFAGGGPGPSHLVWSVLCVVTPAPHTRPVCGGFHTLPRVPLRWDEEENPPPRALVARGPLVPRTGHGIDALRVRCEIGP